MPEYLSPGVYVEEIELGPRPIEGVGTSVAGFLGATLRGPEDVRLVTGFEEFKRLYGGYVSVDDSNLPFAVDGFFKNGGQRCFIARITALGTLATTGVQDGKVRIEALGPGTWGNQIAIKISPASLQVVGVPANQQRFKLTAMYWDVKPPDPLVDPTDAGQITNPNRREPTITEVYDNLSPDIASIDFYETVINGSSSLVHVTRLAPDTPAVLDPPVYLNTLGAAGTGGTGDVLA